MIDFSKPPEHFIEDYYEWWGYKFREKLFGSDSVERYYYHREDGPAEIKHYVPNAPTADTNCMPSKYVWRHIYCLHDKEHRVDGPASVWFDRDGKVVFERYYLLGKKISKKEFETPGFIDAFILEHS